MGNLALLKVTKVAQDPAIFVGIVLIHGMCLFAPGTFSWGAFGVFVGLYLFTGLCISIGFHRLFSHRSYSVPKAVERILAVGGTMALQGSVMEWVAHHRMHHAGTDTEEDPHNSAAGFWFSHLRWIYLRTPRFDDVETLRKFARDIHSDPFMRFLGRFSVQMALQVAVALSLYFWGGFSFLVWGFFVRIAFTHHAIWFVNSATHRWGYRNFATPDRATNLWWVSAVAFGEGWHNNHHAEKESAILGRRRWELDLGGATIKAMAFLHLAHDVQLPKLLARPLESTK